MIKSAKPKHYRYPDYSYSIWNYHRFNDSFRDISERSAYREIIVSHETTLNWCQNFGMEFIKTFRKNEQKETDKWHLDEMINKRTITIDLKLENDYLVIVYQDSGVDVSKKKINKTPPHFIPQNMVLQTVLA